MLEIEEALGSVESLYRMGKYDTALEKGLRCERWLTQYISSLVEFRTVANNKILDVAEENSREAYIALSEFRRLGVALIMCRSYLRKIRELIEDIKELRAIFKEQVAV